MSTAWREAALPRLGGRDVAKDAVRCGDRWLVVGATVRRSGVAGPAAWTSRSGGRWRPVELAPTTYWGRRAVLLGVACRDGTPVAVGAMSGGAHGNPRVSTFRPAGASWVDVLAPAEQYGGPSAVNVGRVAAGDPGWAIVGNRRSGPAVWLGSRPHRFRLVEGAPGLADGPGLTGLAQDVVWTGSEWLVVGGAHTHDALDRRPQAWASPDGRRWRREPVPGTEGYDDLHRAVVVGPGRVLAAGTADGRFAAWVRDADGWRRTATFGGTDPGGSSAPRVTSLTATRSAVLATVTDGSRFGLWGSDDGAAWWPVELPLTVGASADHALVVAAHDTDVLLLGDAGDGARLWVGAVPRHG